MTTLLVSGPFGVDDLPARRYLRAHIIFWHDFLYHGFFGERAYVGGN